jgi:hypothetical protein
MRGSGKLLAISIRNEYKIKKKTSIRSHPWTKAENACGQP